LRVRVNRLGGLVTPDGVLDGLCRVDETDPFMRRALRGRDLVRVSRDGSYLMPAPPGDGPVPMSDIFMPFPEDFEGDDARVDSDFEDTGRPDNHRPRVLDEYSVREMLCLRAAGCRVRDIMGAYGVGRSTVYAVTRRRTWAWVDMPDGARAKGVELMRVMGLDT